MNGVSIVMSFILQSKHASTLSFVACADAVRVEFLNVSLTIRLTLFLSASERITVLVLSVSAFIFSDSSSPSLRY